MTESAELIQLLLDEMFSPLVAEALRAQGHLRALQANASIAGLLFTSSRTFPRSRRQVSPLIDALDAWLAKGPPDPPIIEDWLQPL